MKSYLCYVSGAVCIKNDLLWLIEFYGACCGRYEWFIITCCLELVICYYVMCVIILHNYVTWIIKSLKLGHWFEQLIILNEILLWGNKFMIWFSISTPRYQVVWVKSTHSPHKERKLSVQRTFILANWHFSIPYKFGHIVRYVICHISTFI